MLVKCFGIAKDIIGSSEFRIEAEVKPANIHELKNYINTRYPAFEKYNSYMIALNQCFATDEELLSPSDEIAIIPPVSGG